MTLLEQTIKELIERQINFVCTTDCTGGAVVRNTSLQDTFRISFLNHDCVAIIINTDPYQYDYLKTIDDVIQNVKPFIDYEN